MMQHLFLPDMDGVILDSLGGAIITHPVAYKRALGITTELVPDISKVPEEFVHGMQKYRPMIVSIEDYARVLHYIYENRTNTIDEAVPLQDQILLDQALFRSFAQELPLAREELQSSSQFGKLIKPYTVFGEIYKQLVKRYPTYIVTNKPEPAPTNILLSYKFPVPKIKDATKGTKCDRIYQAMQEHSDIPSEQVHFIEDNVHALLAAKNDERLYGIRLYLADWGYVNDHARKIAKENDIPIVYEQEALINLL